MCKTGTTHIFLYEIFRCVQNGNTVNHCRSVLTENQRKIKKKNAQKSQPWWFCLSGTVETRGIFLFDLLRSYLAF